MLKTTWLIDSNFQTISLHKSIKYLVSDIKNFKESIFKIHKYILNKTIDDNKANEVQNLKDNGKVAWEFILAIYEVYLLEIKSSQSSVLKLVDLRQVSKIKK